MSDEWKETRLKYLCAFINDTKRMDENTEQLLEVFRMGGVGLDGVIRRPPRGIPLLPSLTKRSSGGGGGADSFLGPAPR